MNAQCFWLSSQSGQTQITVGQKHWCCAGGRRWGGAGSPSALIVLLCVWWVAGIGARAHRVSDEERFLWFDNPPQSWSACACVCAYASTSPAGCCRFTSLTYVGRLSEQPHWRSLAVAKPRCRGGQTKVPRWPNQGAAVAKQGAFAS